MTEPLSPATLRARLDDLNRRLEKSGTAPFKAARELETRIVKGKAKIEAALSDGALDRKGPQASDVLAAEKKLVGLESDLRALYREWIIPHYVLHLLHRQASDAALWPLSEPVTFSAEVGNIISCAVVVKPGDEPPF